MARDGYKEVGLEVKEDLKIEWKEAAEKHGYGSLSQLIRKAVKHERMVKNGDLELIKPNEITNDDLQDMLENGVEANINLDPLEDSIYDLEDRLGDVEDQIMEQEVDRMLPNEQELKNLMNRCRDMIPLVTDEDELRSLDAHASMPPKEKAQITGSIGDVTAAIRAAEDPARDDSDPEQDFEVDQLDIEKALTRLETAYGHIHVINHEGDRRFYEVKQ